MLATPGALAQELEAPEAVHSRHPEVEQDDVGRRAGDEWQELMAAERLAHDLDIALARERRSDRCQHQMMIVSDQELEPHFNLPRKFRIPHRPKGRQAPSPILRASASPESGICERRDLEYL